MENVWMYSWSNDSEAARELAGELEIRMLRHRGSSFVPRTGRTVINWGASRLPSGFGRCRVINKDSAVKLSVNKLSFFRATYNSCRTVPWTSCRWEAAKWLADGSKVVCRTTLEGREGAGIAIAEPRRPADGDLQPGRGWLAWILNARPEPTSALPEGCRLFTKFIPSQREYRVHVMGGSCIAVHRKVGGRDEGVRNTANGWVFRRVSDYPRDVVHQATRAVTALGLDFAAVDVLWDGTSAYVLETNTAPGIEGMEWTKRQYIEGFKRLVG